MRRSIIPAVLVLATNCSPVGKPPPTDASKQPLATSAQYEPAPVVTPISFGMPPDLRDKICGETQDRGNGYTTVTKSVNSFCW
jgi:hypothetical protein